ncbi:MAG: signal peptidase I [Myxococcales bacterium]|nr:signal peptidase I [Myxococcales bacterium]
MRSGLGCLSWIGAAVIVVLLLLKVLLFDVASVGHNGMAPTLVHGERVLINKRGKPVRGAIAVCKHPREEGWVVGRVAATEGTAIESFGDVLRLDGYPLQFEEGGTTEFYNEDNDLTRLVVWGDEVSASDKHRIFFDQNRQHLVRKTIVDPGKVYLLGDYRGYMGQDSRAYGQVDAASCRGTIVFRLTPVEGLAPEISHGYFELVQ